MSMRDEANLEAMTANERLCYLGAFADWDGAVRQRDRVEMIAVLKRARVKEPAQVADAVLADPKRYGL